MRIDLLYPSSRLEADAGSLEDRYKRMICMIEVVGWAVFGSMFVREEECWRVVENVLVNSINVKKKKAPKNKN